jgi:hypothetical protein
MKTIDTQNLENVTGGAARTANSARLGYPYGGMYGSTPGFLGGPFGGGFGLWGLSHKIQEIKDAQAAQTNNLLPVVLVAALANRNRFA